MRSLDDGRSLFSCKARDTSFAAADALQGVFYTADGARGVLVWRRDGAGVDSWVPSPVLAAQRGDRTLALAVVPPAAGRLRAHLVAAPIGGRVARVLELPSHRLVGTVALLPPRRRLAGLGADPHGDALVVLDRDDVGGSVAVVLPWPLEGLPALE